ncbi:MAG: aminoglycoside phosphotransferase family protein [Acidimicrobiia bacterium]
MIVTSHANRPVRLAVVNGRAVITKRYVDADPGPVFRAMTDLWASSFGASRGNPGLPEPLGLNGDELTMAFADGEPVAVRGTLGSAVAMSDIAATLLADLHASGVMVPRVRDARALLRSTRRKCIDLASEEPQLQPLLNDLEHRAHAAAGRLPSATGDERLVINHGDFSPRNVLIGTRGAVLIDFDRLQMASPARDVAYWGTWCWTTALLADGNRSWTIADRFLDHYLAQAGSSAAGVVAAQPFHRAMSLVRIAHGWSALRADRVAVRRLLDEANSLLG